MHLESFNLNNILAVTSFQSFNLIIFLSKTLTNYLFIEKILKIRNTFTRLIRSTLNFCLSRLAWVKYSIKQNIQTIKHYFMFYPFLWYLACHWKVMFLESQRQVRKYKVILCICIPLYSNFRKFHSTQTIMKS